MKTELYEIVEEFIEKRDWQSIRRIISEESPPEIAELIMDLEKKSRVILFRIIPKELAAEAFSYLESRDQDLLLGDLTDQETKALLEELSPDDRTEILGELPGQATQRLLNLLSPKDLDEARTLLGYPPESVGRLMTPDYVAVRPEWSIEKSIEHIRKRGRDSETVNMIYVTDHSWRLLDSLELRRFILADPGITVKDIMDYRFTAISPFADREEAVRLIQIYDLVAIPVIDSAGVLLGIVTVDDILDIVEEEVTEDFQKTAAVGPLKTSYAYASFWTLYSKRILWLMILILVNLVSSSIIANFEATLASTIALAFFIPLLIDSGGNAGAQSATLMVRAIATGDVKMTRWMATFLKEILVGISLGITMGLASSLLGLFRGGLEIGLGGGSSMPAIVLVATLIGAMVPFVLTWFKLDPAVASSPLITTIVDAVGLLIYFTIANAIIGSM